MASLKELQELLEKLDDQKILVKKAYELTYNESLGLTGASDFVVGAPYNPWPQSKSQAPKTFESSTAIAFKDVLAKGLPGKASNATEVFIDIALLQGYWVDFFTKRENSASPTLAAYIGDQLDNNVPPNATPIIRILIGGSEPKLAADTLKNLKEDVQNIFWSGKGGKCVFDNPKTQIHIGCYSPSFKLGNEGVDQQTREKLDSLLQIARTMADNLVALLEKYSYSFFVPFGAGEKKQVMEALEVMTTANAIARMTKDTIPSISWNHGKVLAINGKTMMTGGVNYWRDYGDNQNHINDMSVKLRGDAAMSAHKYCNYFWDYLNEDHKSTDAQSVFGTVQRGTNGQADWSPKGKVPIYKGQPSTSTGKAVLTVNKLGDWTGPMKKIEYPIQVIDAIRDLIYNILFRRIAMGTTGWYWIARNDAMSYFFNKLVPSVADDQLLEQFKAAGVTPAAWSSRIARCKAIASAKTSVYIDAATIACALQLEDPKPKSKPNTFLHTNLPTINGKAGLTGTDAWDGVLWPYDLIKAVVAFLNNIKNPSVDTEDGEGLYILLTSSRYNEQKDANGEVIDGTSDKGWADLVAIEEFKKRVKLAAQWWRFDSWWNKSVKVKRISDDGSMMNHCKVLCTDKKLMYVGSDNYYTSYNEEHGVWIEDQDAIKAWYKDYWSPRWAGATVASGDAGTADFAATI